MTVTANVKKIYTFNFFWLFLVIIPLLLPYYTSLGMNTEQFFVLQSIFGLTVALLDVPMGYFSDHYGRKASLCMGALFSGIGYVVLLYARSFEALVFHEFLLGIALSFISGTDVAILYDSLPSDAPREQTSKALGLTHLFYSSGEAIGALLGGVLIAFSFHHVIVAQMVISWIPLVVALLIKEPAHRARQSPDLKSIIYIWKHLLHNDRIMRGLAVNFVINLLSTFIVIWIVQKYWQENGIPLTYFGALWALYAFTIGFTSRSTHALEKKWGAQRLLLLIPVLCALTYFLMVFAHGWLALIVVLPLYVARGLNNVVYRDIINWRIPAELRATANSILNFLFRFCFALLGPLIGYSIDHVGLRPTLSVMGSVVLILTFLCAFPLWKLIKEVKF